MTKENQGNVDNIRSFMMSKIEENREAFFSSRLPLSLLSTKKEPPEDIFEFEVKISSMDDLLAVDSNKAFLESCYEILFGRKIDPSGLKSFMKDLLCGHLSREEIILALYESGEGQQKSKNIPIHIAAGLKTLQKQRKKKKLFEKIFLKLSKFIPIKINLSLSRFLQNEINNIVLPKLYKLKDEIKNDDLKIEYRLKNIEARVLDTIDFVSSLKYKLPHSNTNTFSSDPKLQEFINKFYLDLLNKLRGSEEDILDRNRVYRDIFLKLVGDQKDIPILDIACGRGEMLKIIKELSLNGIGVDTNDTLIEYCKSQSLHVVKADALQYLKSLEDSSLAAISVMHLVEHLEFEYLAKFLLESFRTLQPGGGIIIETPNPLNLVVSAVQFYMDPSHKNPIPMNLMQIILENVGFQVSRIDLSFRQEHDTPERIDNPKLEYMLNNPQDYALLGVKPR